MPCLITRGAASAQGFGFAGAATIPLIYRSKTVGSGTSVTVPSGAVVGDLVFILIAQPNGPDAVTSGGGAWNTTTYGGAGTSGDPVNFVYWRILTAGDLSGGWTKANSWAWVAIDYMGNGASNVARTSNVPRTTGDVVFPSSTPNPAGRGTISMVSSTAAVVLAAPAGFTLRDQGDYGSGPTQRYSFADDVAYTGTSVTWATNGTSGAWGGLFQVT